MRWLTSCALLLTSLAQQGCLVQSRCQSHADCNGDESCDQVTGQCRVECSSDQECTVGGMPVGKECINHRCDFPYGDRRAAPTFCLEAVNPGSSFHGQSVCLEQLRGKVVMLFFALLA